jgi:hypothetical protein
MTGRIRMRIRESRRESGSWIVGKWIKKSESRDKMPKKGSFDCAFARPFGYAQGRLRNSSGSKKQGERSAQDDTM